jgi:F0F1-type ATP synthase assembly protein I
LYNLFTGGSGKMDKERNRLIAKAMMLGSEIVISLFLFVFLGLYIDKKFDISPIGILGGVFLGIGTCFTILLKFGVNKK